MFFLLSFFSPSRASEEEFYFNDVNIESRTTSGVSSTSSNESLVEPPSSSLPMLSIKKPTDSFASSHVGKHESEVIDIPSVPLTTLYMTNKTSYRATKNISNAEDFKPDNFTNKKSKSFCGNQQTVCLVKNIDSPTFSIDFSSMYKTQTDRKPFITTTEKKIKRRKSSGKKKCRKVYGMSNKDLWCTQCRWKKACVRFL